MKNLRPFAPSFYPYRPQFGLWGYEWMRLLPRPWLDQIEISESFVPRFSPGVAAEINQTLRSLKTALVRQDVFRDLYCCDPSLPKEAIVKKSVRRTGPAAVLVDWNADYWIVREDSAPECGVWEEKIAGDPSASAHEYRKNKDLVWTGPRSGHFDKPFSAYAVSVDEVNWNQYDIIVCIDIPVPFRIMEKTTKPLWAFLPGDPGTPTAKRSLRFPPGPFHVSLSHGFRKIPVRPSNGVRTIEFPFTFLSRGTWGKLYPTGPSHERSGTMVEHQTLALLTRPQREALDKIGPVRGPIGSITNVAANLNLSHFYFRCGGGPIIGNGIVEAAAAGCVSVGNIKEFVN